MKYVCFLYQWLVAIPILVVITIIIALSTSIGSILFGGKWWGYYPPHFWAKCWCWLFFIKVKVENRELIDKQTSYVFVANHQSSYDIYSIYGFLGHNFKWMMKKSLEKVPFVGMACRCAGHIMVDRSCEENNGQRQAHAARRNVACGVSRGGTHLEWKDAQLQARSIQACCRFQSATCANHDKWSV